MSGRQTRLGAPTCTNCLPGVTPFCALQACFEGVQVVPIETVMSEFDIFVSSTGNFNFFTWDQMKKLDNNAVVGMSVNFTTRSTWLAQRSWRA